MEIYQDKSGQWRWKLKAGNGRIIADSAEGYTTEQGAKRASKQVMAVPQNVGDITDGYHTFTDLYDHRTELFLVLMKLNYGKSWRSRQHEDGSMFEGMFVAGIHTPAGDITYHIEDTYWELFDGIITLEKAEAFDGHTSDDVLQRLKEWAKQL